MTWLGATSCFKLFITVCLLFVKLRSIAAIAGKLSKFQPILSDCMWYIYTCINCIMNSIVNLVPRQRRIFCLFIKALQHK